MVVSYAMCCEHYRVDLKHQRRKRHNMCTFFILALYFLQSGGEDSFTTTTTTPAAALPFTTCNGAKDADDCVYYPSDICASWTMLHAKCPVLCQTCPSLRRFDYKLKNVLLLSIDDLRAQLGHQDRASSQGDDLSYMQTPHLDAFAANNALVLSRAYVQIAICTASRTSVLTGRRPDTTQAYELDNYWRDGRCSNCKTLPQHFLLSGYKYVVGMGKVFHHGKASDFQDQKYSWTQEFDTGPPTTRRERLQRGENNGNGGGGDDDGGDDDDDGGGGGGLRSGPINIDEEGFGDTNVTSLALEHLSYLKQAPELGPWFIAVGLKKPHLPFNCPARFFSLYNQSDLPIADNDYICSNDKQTPYPKLARRSFELQQYPNAFVAYETLPNGTRTGREQRSELFKEKGCDWRLSETRTRELTQGYLACVSYVDEQAGRLFKGLQANGFWDNTVVVVWSDHGFKLGDHHAWCKHTNFDVDLHVPFMIRVPGMPGNGRTSKTTVEMVDLFPTVVEAAGLTPVPPCPPVAADSAMVDLCADGRSLMPLVQGNTLPPKVAASQYLRQYQSVMGYSIITPDAVLRFGAWVTIDADGTTGWDRNKLTGQFGNLELYNHTDDPKEKRNLAGRTEERSRNNAALVPEPLLNKLFALLQDTFPQGNRTTTTQGSNTSTATSRTSTSRTATTQTQTLTTATVTETKTTSLTITTTTSSTTTVTLTTTTTETTNTKTVAWTTTTTTSTSTTTATPPTTTTAAATPPSSATATITTITTLATKLTVPITTTTTATEPDTATATTTTTETTTTKIITTTTKTSTRTITTTITSTPTTTTTVTISTTTTVLTTSPPIPSTEALSRNTTAEVDAVSIAISSNPRVATPKPTTIDASPTLMIETRNSSTDNNDSHNDSSVGGSDGGEVGLSSSEDITGVGTLNVILIALGASVLSTVCGVAWVVYRYERPNAKRKLAAQLAVSLAAAAKVTRDIGGQGGQSGLSQSQLLGLLQSEEGVDAVIREAVKRSAVKDNSLGYYTGALSPSAGHRGSANSRFHDTYDAIEPVGGRGSEILDLYLLSQGKSDFISTHEQPLGRARLNIRREVSNESAV